MAWKVVIVEDEDLLRNGLISTISWDELGYEVAGDADNGKDGLELVKRVHPEVVFSDIRMAQMDGLTMAEQIREWDKNIQIVFISGYDEFDYAVQALKIGASEYILKPIQLEQVREVLQKIAGQLRQTEQKKTEYDKMKELEEYGLDKQRQELFQTAIYHYGALEEYKNARLEKEEHYYYSVWIVEWSDFAVVSMNSDYMEIMEMDHRFEKKLKEILPGGNYSVVRGSACERVIIFYGDRSVDVSEKENWARAEIDKAKKERIAFRISCGKIEEGLEGLQRSYIAARYTLQNQLWEDWNNSVSTPKEETVSVNFINYDKKPLLAAIRSGSRERIIAEFCRMEEMVNRKPVSHIHIILIVTSIFEDMVSLPDEIGESIEKIMGRPIEDFQRIISKGKQAEILEGLKEYSLALGECFARNEENSQRSALTRAISYMKREYGNKDLLLADVAKHAYISTSYLSLLLKKETGKTFIEYLTDIRMVHAKKLLNETMLKNYEVAEACGFANATYFSTVFKSVFGVSPSTFRRNNG